MAIQAAELAKCIPGEIKTLVIGAILAIIGDKTMIINCVPFTMDVAPEIDIYCI